MTQSMTQKSNLIAPRELNKNLGNSSWCVIDCRFDLGDPDAGRKQYGESHIPGAVFADLDRDLASPVGPHTGRHPLPDVRTFEATLGALGIESTSQVVVYDAANGALASRAWWLMRWAGHTRVRLLDGGLENWLRCGYDTCSGDEQPSPGNFVARPTHEMVVTTQELADDPDAIVAMRLIDARDAARFRGEEEPIDPVAGHIPGAINVPLTMSLGDDGTWKTRDELRQIWSGVLGEDKAASWAVMCGSGVTACHLALSGMEAGYAEPRVYVGSWSEWIRDPARPIGLGPT